MHTHSSPGARGEERTGLSVAQRSATWRKPIEPYQCGPPLTHCWRQEYPETELAYDANGCGERSPPASYLRTTGQRAREGIADEADLYAGLALVRREALARNQD